MPNSLTELNFTLITGNLPSTGTPVTWNKTLENTIFYGMSGNNTGSYASLYIDVADPLGNFGYVLDAIVLSGSGVQTNVATFTTPLTLLRGIISGVSLSSGLSGVSTISNAWIYGDTSF